MSMLQSIKRTSRKLITLALAAGLTLAVLFISVLIYKWSVYEPEPPLVANCDSLQVLTAYDGSAEVSLHQCRRGENPTWQGYEVWLYTPGDTEWLRIATAEQQGCFWLSMRDEQLTLYHQQSRGNVSLSQSSVVIPLLEGAAAALSIVTERVEECPVELP